VLLRLAYLGVTNTLALLRLLPMSDRAKDAETLTLRHQIIVLERHLHGEKIRFTWADRACGSPPCYTNSPATYSGRSGCWSAPRPCCAGTVT
jgi:hypothetical protein